MRKLQLSLMLAAVVLLTSCGKGSEAGISFSNYVKDADVENPDGLVASLELTLPMPQGEGEPQTRVTNAIKELVSRSRIAEELGSPEGESVKAIADNYHKRFSQGVSEGNLEPQCVYHLQITSPYSNSQCAVLHVSDGVFANGGPREYVWNVRLSDGKLMTFQEISTMNRNDLIQLAEQYATDEYYEDISLNLEDCWLYPTSEGCKVKVQTGPHLFKDFVIPMESVVPYLTDEGKKLFGVATEKESDKEEAKAANDNTFLSNILTKYRELYLKGHSASQIEQEIRPTINEAKQNYLPVTGSPYGISCKKAVIAEYNLHNDYINIILNFVPDEGTSFHLDGPTPIGGKICFGPYGKMVRAVMYAGSSRLTSIGCHCYKDEELQATMTMKYEDINLWKGLDSIQLIEDNK